MSKKILILEPSTTTQAIMTAKLKKSEYEPVYETSGIKFLVAMYNSTPQAVLINAKTLNPKSNELVRLIKSVDRLKKIPVGVYSAGDFSFESHYMRNTGTDLFIHFDPENFVEKLDELTALANSSKRAAPMESDILKSGIAENIFALMRYIGNLDRLAENILNLLTEFCEVPAVSIFLNEEDGAEGFYLCSTNFTEAEEADFLKVCVIDFDEKIPDTNIRMVTPKKMKSEFDLEKYHRSDIPLSAFQSVEVKGVDNNSVGLINVVREGTFTTHQLDLLNFCVELLTPLINNAIYLKRKIKFERNIRKAFSRFVPAQIIDELVKGAEQSDKVSVGEKRDVAILFSDIRSFTSISERN